MAARKQKKPARAQRDIALCYTKTGFIAASRQIRRCIRQFNDLVSKGNINFNIKGIHVHVNYLYAKIV